MRIMQSEFSTMVYALEAKKLIETHEDIFKLTAETLAIMTSTALGVGSLSLTRRRRRSLLISILVDWM